MQTIDAKWMCDQYKQAVRCHVVADSAHCRVNVVPRVSLCNPMLFRYCQKQDKGYTCHPDHVISVLAVEAKALADGLQIKPCGKEICITYRYCHHVT